MFCELRRTVLSSVLISIAATSSGLATSYSIIDLGDLPGGVDSSVGININDLGQVTGYGLAEEDSIGISPTRAFLWDPVTGMQEIGNLPEGLNSVGSAINDAGQVAGFVYGDSSTPPTRAFLWDPVTGMEILEPLPGDNFSTVTFGLNNAGQVAGTSSSSPSSQAVVWDPDTGIQDLSELQDGELLSGAGDINNSGQIVGQSIVWDPVSGARDIDVLPGARSSFGSAINNLGQVAGSSGGRAILWDPTTGSRDLGVAPGFSSSQGTNLNDVGQVVGSGNKIGEGRRAVVWDVVNGMRDLNDLIAPDTGWDLLQGIAINNHGQITGSGQINGVQHAFLLTPVAVPLPAGFPLLLAGLVAIGFVRRKPRWP